jgi:hypothetical protein
MTSHVVERFGIKTIIIPLAQRITRPLHSVTLRIKLFYGRIYFFENFTMFDLDNFDVILGNTFLDAYKINIFHSGGRLKVYAKCGSKLMNLDAKYNYALAKMGMNLVALAIELKLFSFLF